MAASAASTIQPPLLGDAVRMQRQSYSSCATASRCAALAAVALVAGLLIGAAAFPAVNRQSGVANALSHDVEAASIPGARQLQHASCHVLQLLHSLLRSQPKSPSRAPLVLNSGGIAYLRHSRRLLQTFFPSEEGTWGNNSLDFKPMDGQYYPPTNGEFEPPVDSGPVAEPPPNHIRIHSKFRFRRRRSLHPPVGRPSNRSLSPCELHCDRLVALKLTPQSCECCEALEMTRYRRFDTGVNLIGAVGLAGHDIHTG